MRLDGLKDVKIERCTVCARLGQIHTVIGRDGGALVVVRVCSDCVYIARKTLD